MLKYFHCLTRSFLFILICGLLLASCSGGIQKPEPSVHDLVFSDLAETWDQGIPLGNGMIGALVWKKGDTLRISLDRADLWDLRPMENAYREGLNYDWVYDRWQQDKYKEVQEMFDRPYSQSAGPSKIPAAALEIPLADYGPVSSSRLIIHNGLCRIEWQNGMSMDIFIHPERPVGWFEMRGTTGNPEVKLIPPAYGENNLQAGQTTGQQALSRLGYPRGDLVNNGNSMDYHQEGWGGFSYRVHCRLERPGGRLLGCWSISSDYPGREETIDASGIVEQAWEEGYGKSREDLFNWWNRYWSASMVRIPDTVLQKQWYLEMYKFGAAARKGAPPICLQAVWTADDGRLPPWKGDFHHDLNTQLSYWPAYSGNHLDLEVGFLDWLWGIRDEGKEFTSWFYQAEGLNIPGVTTLTGQPMGGWIQYSFGPTVSAWLAHHFYLHWRYSLDRLFLEERAYPWLKDVAIFLDQISVMRKDGKRKLLISSSPEIYNNSRAAWFGETTNYDLALIRFTYKAAAEMAAELGLEEEAARWRGILSEWPELAADPETGLVFAPGFPYNGSHRHFSHLMGFHPLGLLDLANGQKDREIILNTIRNLEVQGPGRWSGYSFSWLGNLYARVGEGENAAEALMEFATCRTSPNSFHLNRDQCRGGSPEFLGGPFTLEGNFAFASGIHEMLLQSHTGIIRVFPAVPGSWQEAGFDNLRAEGAFLVSAERRGGKTVKVKIEAEKEGPVFLANPFSGKAFGINGKAAQGNLAVQDTIIFDMQAGEILLMEI